MSLDNDLSKIKNARLLNISEVPHLTEKQVKDANAIVKRMYDELHHIGVKMDYDYSQGRFFVHDPAIKPFGCYENDECSEHGFKCNYDRFKNEVTLNYQPLSSEAREAIIDEGLVLDESNNNFPFFYDESVFDTLAAKVTK